MDWDLDYVDGKALASSIEVLIAQRWNDFIADSPRPVIYDCGANIGVSVLNYKRQYPEARIMAFEADPEIAKILRSNLLRNRASDVTVVEAAVWRESGRVSFRSEGADGSRVASGVRGDDVIEVPSIDFLEYIAEPVDLLKMDIEGAEHVVIPHIASKLALVKNAVVECHLSSREVGKFARLLDVLASSGFNVAVNSYGSWRDLSRSPTKQADDAFDQYVLVAAWRDKQGVQ